ncbi:GIY-YIG nuclease family protein [Enterococcus sp. LJL99]
MEKQFDGKGAIWTKKYKPLSIVESKDISNLESAEIEILVNSLVIKYMQQYGWENVRGGKYVVSDQKILKRTLIKHKILTYEGSIQLPTKKNIELISEKKYLYCLSLEDGRYYVGISKNPDKRFYQHTNSKAHSALYTKKYKPKCILFVQDLGVSSEFSYLKMETQATINLMKLVGCYKVRGGDFLHVDDYQEFELFKNTIRKNKSKFTFPTEWLEYTFEDFMKGINYIPKSIKEIL